MNIANTSNLKKHSLKTDHLISNQGNRELPDEITIREFKFQTPNANRYKPQFIPVCKSFLS